jgi:hypothetical protein
MFRMMRVVRAEWIALWTLQSTVREVLRFIGGPETYGETNATNPFCVAREWASSSEIE